MESKQQQEINEIKETVKRLEKLLTDMTPIVSIAVAKISTLSATLDTVTRKFAQIPHSQVALGNFHVIKPVAPDDDSSELGDEEQSVEDEKVSKKRAPAQTAKPKAVKQDQGIEKVKGMEFLFKKTVNKCGEEYVMMTGKPAHEIENEIKAFKARLFQGDAKSKKWSIDLGTKIIEDIATSKQEFPILHDIFVKKQIVAQD